MFPQMRISVERAILAEAWVEARSQFNEAKLNCGQGDRLSEQSYWPTELIPTL